MISTWLLRLDRQLAGAPDELLSLALLTVAGVLVVAALRASSSQKAVLLSWVVAP